MAYDPKTPPVLLANGIGGATGLRHYAYRSTTDSVATVLGAGYIRNARKLGLRVGDAVRFVDPNMDSHHLQVGAIDEFTGAGTLEFPSVSPLAIPQADLLDLTQYPATVVAFQGGQQIQIPIEQASSALIEIATEEEAVEGTLNGKRITPLRLRQTLDNLDGTVSDMAGRAVPVSVQSFHVNGYDETGVGGFNVIRSDNEPEYYPKFQDQGGGWFEMERKTPLVSLHKFGAKGEGSASDDVAIQRAWASGEDLFLPRGLFYIEQTMQPAQSGQRMQGAGKVNAVIQNPYNNEPLFIGGDPTRSDGAMDYITLRDFSLFGKTDGATLWGIFLPSNDEYEGLSSSVNNYYHAVRPFSASWTGASRNCVVENVSVRYIYGGYTAHVSSWCNKFTAVNLWSSMRGLRNAGDANSNAYRGLYISTMSREAIIHPTSPLSIPTATLYSDIVVQQCGGDDNGRGSIVFNKGQGTVVQALYLERNNEKAFSNPTETHIYVGVSESGLGIDGVRYRDDQGGATIIHNCGSGTRIGSIVAPLPADATPIKTVILHDGNDARTQTYVQGPIRGVSGSEPTTTDGVITTTGTNSLELYVQMPASTRGYGLGALGDKVYKDGNKVALRAAGTTSRTLALESSGDMRFVTDFNNGTVGGNFDWYHNGEDALGTRLMRLQTSNGALAPGSDNTQALGGGSGLRWSTVYAGTGTINTSDEREKADISEIPDTWLDAWADVGWQRFKFTDGTSGRWHVGLVAQSVRDAFAAHGLDAFEIGLLCYDQWDDQYDEWDAEYKEIGVDDGTDEGTTEVVIVREAGRKLSLAAGDRYGIRYDEAQALEAAWMRRALSRLRAKVES